MPMFYSRGELELQDFSTVSPVNERKIVYRNRLGRRMFLLSVYVVELPQCEPEEKPREH